MRHIARLLALLCLPLASGCTLVVGGGGALLEHERARALRRQTLAPEAVAVGRAVRVEASAGDPAGVAGRWQGVREVGGARSVVLRTRTGETTVPLTPTTVVRPRPRSPNALPWVALGLLIDGIVLERMVHSWAGADF